MRKWNVPQGGKLWGVGILEHLNIKILVFSSWPWWGMKEERPEEDTSSRHWADPVQENPELHPLPLAAACHCDKLFTQLCAPVTPKPATISHSQGNFLWGNWLLFCFLFQGFIHFIRSCVIAKSITWFMGCLQEYWECGKSPKGQRMSHFPGVCATFCCRNACDWLSFSGQLWELWGKTCA